MFSSRWYRLTTFLGVAAYITASTFNGLLHDHADAHGGHANAHGGTATCCHHDADCHDADHACSEHAEHEPGPAGLGVLPAGKATLHDDDCAACRFVSQRVLPAAHVSLVVRAEWSVELSAIQPSRPFTTANRTTHSRAPPLLG